MKKRRELDALVNGKGGSSRRKKNGQHELLRNESDSSDEIEEFTMPQKNLIRKSSAWRLCSTCMTLCGLFLLTTCIVGVAGLVWVHVELKKDVDDLRAQIHKAVTEGQSDRDALVGIPQTQRQLQKALHSLEANITELNHKVNALTTTTNSLKSNIPNNQPYQLPDTIKELPTTVATIGSQIATLQDTINKVDEFEQNTNQELSNIRERFNDIKSREDGQLSSESDGDISEDQNLLRLSNAVTALTDNVAQNISMIMHHSHMHTVAIQSLQNLTGSLNDRIGLLELQPATPATNTEQIQTVIEESIKQVMIEMEKSNNTDVTQNDIAHLQEQIDACAINVQHIQSQIVELQQDDLHTPSMDEVKIMLNSYQNETNNILKSLNDSLVELRNIYTTQQNSISVANSLSTVLMKDITKLSTTTSKPVNVQGTTPMMNGVEEKIINKSTQSSQETTMGSGTHIGEIHVPGINTATDLAAKFRQWDGDVDHKLSSEEVIQFLGKDVLNQLISDGYDSNGDGFFSEDELQSALL